jgi:DNA-binding transcriptional regulator YdaS (Cro superfamily)
MKTGIERAVQLAGSQSALGRLLKVTPQAVQKWVAQGFAPAERCREIELALGGAVTRAELNPEIFGGTDASPH